MKLGAVSVDRFHVHEVQKSFTIVCSHAISWTRGCYGNLSHDQPRIYPTVIRLVTTHMILVPVECNYYSLPALAECKYCVSSDVVYEV